MSKTESRAMKAAGNVYTALNLITPPTVEGIEKAMSMTQYVFAERPEQKISDENAKAKLGELSTEAQSHLVLTNAENTQRIKEGKQPY